MSDHTPEPWAIYEGESVHGVLDSTGRHLAEMWLRKDWDSLANARRIVACVNACRGIETDLIEQMTAAVIAGNPVHEALYGAQQLTRERDEARAMVRELLEALKDASDWLESDGNEAHSYRAIIAKAEGLL